MARPAETTTYVLRATSSEGCDALDTVVVTVLPLRRIVAHIGRDHVATFGTPTLVPIVLDSVVGAPLDAIRIAVEYDPSILVADELNTDAALLQGWTRVSQSQTLGRIEVALEARGAAPLTDAGVLGHVRLRGYLGGVRSSELPLEIGAAVDSCGSIAAAPGAIALDSLCGLSTRLFEMVGETYALERIAPNPVRGATVLRFSLGLDGPARLTIHDIHGHVVTTLVDGYLRAGDYEVLWNATALPDGVYFYRLESGDWTETEAMVVAREE
jgi:hypothetical protein